MSLQRYDSARAAALGRSQNRPCPELSISFNDIA